jgi:uncharacterized membrane protein SirB2
METSRFLEERTRLKNLFDKYFLKKPPPSRDFIIITSVSIVVFTISATFDIFNSIISWIYRHDTWQLDELFTVAVYLVFAITIYARRRHRELVVQMQLRKQVEAEKAQIIPELERARADVSVLKRLLPICSSCKRVRDDKGYWNRVEVYIETHFFTKLDDGTCPDCARELYGRQRRALHSNTLLGNK